MDSKTALRGPNASAGPIARSITAIVRPRVRSTQLFSWTSSGGQYGLWCNRNTETHPWTFRIGLGHDHPRHLDHRRMYVQQRSLKVAGYWVPGLHVPPDYECSNLAHQSGDQKCCDRIPRSALPRSPCVLRGMSIGPNNNNRLYSLSSPLSRPGVRVEAIGTRSC